MNKMIKKRISILLCVVLLLSNNMSIFSFADIVENNIASESVVKALDENVGDISQNDNAELSSVSEPNEILDTEVDYVINDEDEDGDEENIPEPEDDDVNIDFNMLYNVSSSSELENNENDLLSATLESIIEATLSEVDNNGYKNDILSTKSNLKRNFLVNKENIYTATISIATTSNISLDVATDSDAEIHGLGFVPVRTSVSKFKKKKKLFAASSGSGIPTRYDSRASISDAGLSYIPPIRNQGNYGTCWAFASLGLMEISARKKNLVNNEEDSNLSELALAYSYYHLQNITDSTNTEKPGVEGNDYVVVNNWAMDGGNQDMALFAMSAYMGAVKENDDTKYENMSSIYGGNPLDKKYAFNNNAFELNNVQFINKADTDVIKKAIMDNGAVSISYHEANSTAESGSFSRYDSGKCYYLSNKPQDEANHAVIVVGWDDSIEASKFPSNYAHGNGGWLVRNSWGDSSRNNGYFWLSYSEPSLFEIVYSADVIKADTYKYNYHYDTIGCAASEPIYNSEINPSSKQYIGNVFKISNDEDQSLDAISVGVDSLNAKFDIEIYAKDTRMNNPFDGTLKLRQENYTTTTAGIYTIPLNTKIAFKKNTYYSIVIKPKYSEDVSGAINSTAYYIDYTDDSDPSIKFYSDGNAGESFKWSGNAWYDMDNLYSDKTRFCVKGLTNPYTFPSTNPVNTQQTEEYRPRYSGGGGGGGGGGGSIKANLITPLTTVPKQSEAPIISFKADNTAVISINAQWSFDSVLNTWSLNPDIANLSIKATSGIYSLISLDVNGNIVSDSYCFDAEGHMMTGWVKDGVGNTYFFNNSQGADIGKMTTGWKEIGTGEWYYFADDGKLSVNVTTPDGYKVDAEGKWIK